MRGKIVAGEIETSIPYSILLTDTMRDCSAFASVAPVRGAGRTRTRVGVCVRRGAYACTKHHVGATKVGQSVGSGGVRLLAVEGEAAGREEKVIDTPHRLSLGEQARTVVHVCRSGTLCTASSSHSGVPFGSHADYVLCDDGQPAFLLANGAQHTANLARVSQCSLYAQPPATAGQDGSRATLVGVMRRLSEKEEEEIRERYIETHAHAAYALQYPDLFAFYKMHIDDVFFVGGFGVVATWVGAKDFLEAQADPLCFDAPAIVRQVNAKQSEDLQRLCRVFLGVEKIGSVTLVTLDRLGFDLRVRDGKGDFREYRVAFRELVNNRFDAQSALVKTFQEAWEREMGHADSWADDDERRTIMYYSVR